MIKKNAPVKPKFLGHKELQFEELPQEFRRAIKREIRQDKAAKILGCYSSHWIIESVKDKPRDETFYTVYVERGNVLTVFQEMYGRFRMDSIGSKRHTVFYIKRRYI